MAAAGLLAVSAGWPGDPGAEGAAALAHPELTAYAAWVQALGLWLYFGALESVRGRPDRSVRQKIVAAIRLGGLFGLVWQAATLAWLHVGLHGYAGLSGLGASAAVLALALYLALYSSLAAALYVVSAGADVPLSAGARLPTAFAASMLLAELGRGTFFTGFGWAGIGYAQVEGPLRSGFAWVGVYGVGAAAAWLVAWGWCVVHDLSVAPLARWGRIVGGVLLSVLLLHALDRDFTRSQGEMDVALFQGNFDQRTRYERAWADQAIQFYFSGMRASAVDLALAPETAIPVLPTDLPAEHWAYLRDGTRPAVGAMLIGMPEGPQADARHNALIGLRAGAPYRYVKSHLVPFGEFTPPGFAWFTSQLDIPLKSFHVAEEPAQNLELPTRSGPVQRVAPVICFEDLFGEEIAQRFRDPARAPTVLANASNLAWFEDSPAIAQHLRIAQARSLELQRPTLRATNTGATVIIDHRGRVVRALAPRTQGVLRGVVEGRLDNTPYAAWVARAGLWPAWAVGLAGLAWAAWRGAAPRRTRRSSSYSRNFFGGVE